jgi:hypothetical protein
LAERIEREQIAVAGDDQISTAVDGQLENLSSCGSRHTAIRSVMVTSSALASSFARSLRNDGTVTAAMCGRHAGDTSDFP